MISNVGALKPLRVCQHRVAAMISRVDGSSGAGLICIRGQLPEVRSCYATGS